MFIKHCERVILIKEVANNSKLTLIVQTRDMFLPSMTSRYMVVGDTSGMQANSCSGSPWIFSPMTLGGEWHLGSTE